MLTVKHLTLFKPKNWKKAGIFYQGCKQKFEINLVLRFSLLITEI